MSIENGPILQILTYSDLLSFGISSSADDVAAFSSVFWPHSNQIIPIGQSNERSASESELAGPRPPARSKRTFYRVIVTVSSRVRCSLCNCGTGPGQRDALTLFSAALGRQVSTKKFVI